MIQRFDMSHFFNTAEGETTKYKDANYKKMTEIAATFNFETFYISRYIQSHLKLNKQFKDKYKDTDKKDKIIYLVVTIDTLSQSIKYFKDSRGLCFDSTDTYEDILPLRGTKRADKILEVISKSANAFEQYIPGVKETIYEAIDTFKQAGYKNIWVHQKRRLKGVGTVKLVCELTMFEFTLDLVVEDKEKEIYKKRLITTMPDSLFYHSLFKTLLVSEKEISVTDRISEKPFFTISLKDVLANKNGKFMNFPKHYEVNSNLGIMPTLKSKFFEAFKECMDRPEGVPCPDFEK